jgi:hypothetical protein
MLLFVTIHMTTKENPSDVTGDLVSTVSSSTSYCQANFMCPETSKVAVFCIHCAVWTGDSLYTVI